MRTTAYTILLRGGPPKGRPFRGLFGYSVEWGVLKILPLPSSRCDLFPHVGDQTPARLLRFASRDYFEPTAAINCPTPTEDTSTDSVPRSSSIALMGNFSRRTPSSARNPLLLKEPVIGVGEPSCSPDQIPRYMRTMDFELHSNDDVRMERISLEECIDLCSNNFAAGKVVERQNCRHL